MRNLDEIKIGELAKLLSQYRPYILTVVALLLILVVLPIRRNQEAEQVTPSAGFGSNERLAPEKLAEEAASPAPPAVESYIPPVFEVPQEVDAYEPPPPPPASPPRPPPPPPAGPSPSPSPSIGCLPAVGCR